jgi:hypothetical protein
MMIYVNKCPHEWHQGRCIHCDVPAKNGYPDFGPTKNGYPDFGPPEAPTPTDITTVPDHHDRIVWRGTYYYLAAIKNLSRPLRGLCDRHPEVNARNAWGCPDCMKEARDKLKVAVTDRDEARRELDQTKLDRNGMKSALDAEIKGNREMRERLGARENESMFEFTDRLAKILKWYREFFDAWEKAERWCGCYVAGSRSHSIHCPQYANHNSSECICQRDNLEFLEREINKIDPQEEQCSSSAVRPSPKQS